MVVAICYIEGEINPANDCCSRYIHLLSTAYIVFPIAVAYRDYHRQLSTPDRIMRAKNSRKRQHFALGASFHVVAGRYSLYLYSRCSCNRKIKLKHYN